MGSDAMLSCDEMCDEEEFEAAPRYRSISSMMCGGRKEKKSKARSLRGSARMATPMAPEMACAAPAPELARASTYNVCKKAVISEEQVARMWSRSKAKAFC